jgi:hypothetical protein
MNTEVVQQFWAALQQGVFITEAAECPADLATGSVRYRSVVPTWRTS